MTGTAAAYLAGRIVRHAFFAALHFKSETVYVWTGFRVIELNGQTWQPVGPVATVDQMEDPVADQAPSVVLKLSGVEPEILALAVAQADEVRGRLAFIYDQFFDEDWQPLDAMENYAVVRMDVVRATKSREADDSWSRVISVPSEYLLTNGANPPNGRYSSADQDARHPGQTDRYFEFMGANQNKRARWPTF